MSKIKLDSEEFIVPVINYMLREHDADYDSVMNKPVIKGVDWFQYYWDTPESKEEFNKWLKNFIKTKVKYKPYKVDTLVSIIDLKWGLKVYENG